MVVVFASSSGVVFCVFWWCRFNNNNKGALLIQTITIKMIKFEKNDKNEIKKQVIYLYVFAIGLWALRLLFKTLGIVSRSEALRVLSLSFDTAFLRDDWMSKILIFPKKIFLFFECFCVHT